MNLDVDEEGDEDEEEWEEGAEDLIDKVSSYEGPTAKEIENNRRLGHLFRYCCYVWLCAIMMKNYIFGVKKMKENWWDYEVISIEWQL